MSVSVSVSVSLSVYNTNHTFLVQNMWWFTFLNLVYFIAFCKAIDIKGNLNLSPYNITDYKITRTYFDLQQIDLNNIDSDSFEFYRDRAYINNINGDFKFENIPINLQINETAKFIIYPRSIDFNLKPNRVLIEFTLLPNGTLTQNAWKNYFGREYYPSVDNKFAEKLDQIDMEPSINFTLVNKQPFRQYFQERNSSLLENGFIASILSSRWKMALVITGIALMIFPMIVEYIDPETSQELKLENERKQRAKYEVKKND